MTERRKRRRTIHSCTECHRRKQRCDRGLPCTNCASRRAHAECAYANNPTADATNVTISMVNQIDSGVSASSGGSALHSVSPNRSNADDSVGSCDGMWHERAAPESDQVSASLPPLTHLEVDSLGYSKNSLGNALALLLKVKPHNGALVASYDQLTDWDKDLNAKYRSVVRQLPARPYCEILVTLFFEAVNWHYGVLEKEVFIELYDTWWQQGYLLLTEGGPHCLPRDLQLFPALLYQVLAQALQFLPPKHDECLHHLKMGPSQTFGELSAEYSECGLEIVAAIGRENATLICVQQDFLRASWLKNSGRVAEAWHSLGQAIRAAHEIGLHRDPESDAPDSTVRGTIETIWNTQLRQRVWINLLIWDGHMSLILDRPMTINLRDCRVSPPVDCVVPSNRFDRLPTPQYGVPTALTARLLEYRLAVRIPEILALHAAGRYPRGQDQDTMEEIHQFGTHFQKTLPSTHRFDNPDRSWDAECPFLPAQRELLVCHTNAFLLGLHRPYILQTERDQDRALTACIAILDSQERLFHAFDVQYYKLYSLSFFTFDAAVMLSVILVSNPGYHIDVFPRALQSLADAVSRLRIIAERITLANTGCTVIQALVARLKLIQRRTLITRPTGLPPTRDDRGIVASRSSHDPGATDTGNVSQDPPPTQHHPLLAAPKSSQIEHELWSRNMNHYLDIPVPIPSRDLAEADLMALNPSLGDGSDLYAADSQNLFHFEGDFAGNSFWNLMNSGFVS